MKNPNAPALAASVFLFLGAGMLSAQPSGSPTPSPAPSAAPVSSQATTPLAELLPRNPEVSSLEALARSGAWRDLRAKARDLVPEKAVTMKTDAPGIGAAFALLALGDAGAGDPDGGICRWQAAQILDPRLRQADLSAYGAPGRLLQANPVQDDVFAHEIQGSPGAAGKKDAVQAPHAVQRRAPQYTSAARKARIQGAAHLKAILAESGRMTQPRILQAPPLGLGAMMVDAFCDWRFEPARFEGKPVKVYYDLTTNFKIDQPPAARP